jgi:hypothetical protein
LNWSSNRDETDGNRSERRNAAATEEPPRHPSVSDFGASKEAGASCAPVVEKVGVDRSFLADVEREEECVHSQFGFYGYGADGLVISVVLAALILAVEFISEMADVRVHAS